MENKLEDSIRNLNNRKILFLIVIGAVIIRLLFTPFNLPLSTDAFSYFIYAVLINRELVFPHQFIFSNFGLSVFLSPFFGDSINMKMLELMNIQRIFCIIISSLSVIPIFYFLKEFFKDKISILVSVLFVFNPILITNSILGLTDTLFQFFIILSLAVFFYNQKKYFFISFIFISLASFIRYEGLFLLVPFFIGSYLFRNKIYDFNKKLIYGIILFSIIFIITNFIGYSDNEQFTIIQPFIQSISYFSRSVVMEIPDDDDLIYNENVENGLTIFIINSSTSFVKNIFLILIPSAIFFTFIGATKLIKTKITSEKIFFLILFLFMNLSVFYAYGRGIEDPRYLLGSLPIFSLLSCITINKFPIFKKRKVVTIFVIFVIFSSTIFMIIKNNDGLYYEEIYFGTKILAEQAKGVNIYDGAKFVKIAEQDLQWPILLNPGDDNRVGMNIKKFSYENFDEPLDFIIHNKDKGLTHLFVIKNEDEGFFDKLYYDNENYPFLELVFDSKKNFMTHEFKIFKINFDKME